MNELKFKSYLESKEEKSKHYYNVVGGFDIETTMFDVIGDKKYSKANYCYFWSFSLDGVIFTYGRDPEEFFKFLLDLNPKKTLIIYVHWLRFEYRNLKWLFDKYFPEHKPDTRGKDIQRIVTRKYIFRCSSVLTNGMKLEDMGKEIGIEKLELDYSVPRNRNTWLTTENIAYGLRDVEILCKWILATAKSFNLRISQIATTPRKIYGNFLIKNKLYPRERENRARRAYEHWKDEDDFKKFNKAFRNGITTLNDDYTNERCKDILHGDISSAYSYIMVKYGLPKKFTKKGIKKLPKDSKKVKLWINDIYHYAILARFTFKNIRLKEDAPCKIIDKIRKDGIYSSYMTNIEYKIIEKYYDYDSVEWEDLQETKLIPLDSREVKTIHELFNLKEKSRDTPGYGLRKVVLNSGFGDKSINYAKWNDDNPEKRKSYYPQGVWIAAWQRYIISSLIWEIGEDFIYTNTDSVFCKNTERARKILEDYNNTVPFEKLGKFRLKHLKEFYVAQASRYVITYDDGTTETRCSGVSRKEKDITVNDLINYSEGGEVVVPDGNSRWIESDEIRPYTGYINGELVTTYSFLYRESKTVVLAKGCHDLKLKANWSNSKWIDDLFNLFKEKEII